MDVRNILDKRWHSLKISRHLPAPVVNAGGDSLRKWTAFHLSRACDLDLGTGHTAQPSCVAQRPLPTYQISLKSKKLFVDGRTDVRTGGRTFETHFKVDSDEST